MTHVGIALVNLLITKIYGPVIKKGFAEGVSALHGAGHVYVYEYEYVHAPPFN